MRQEASNVPRFIHLDVSVRHEILTEFPDLEPVTSIEVTEDTTMSVSIGVSKVFVEDEEKDSKGIMHLNIPAFRLIMHSLRLFINEVKHGSRIKDAATSFVESISKTGSEAYAKN